ncbi:MAG TPA: hypothetical protein VMU50_03755 [Polyangia bacterium]|nr:hypothetical protein [Polyangia bacterium]
MRRVRPLVLVLCLVAGALTSCRRRAPGTCADHVDCDPGFDCVNQRCTRRPPVGSALPPPVAAAPAAMPPAAAVEPTPSVPSAEPAPASPEPTRPARPRARPDGGAAPAAGATPVDQTLPLWKQRSKTF